MYKVKIFGAGSIGNHLANACRTMGWDVTICDMDPKALERTKNEIYPQRYGAWDNNIKLCTLSEAPINGFDIVIIGTPPHTHTDIAISVLKNEKPKLLQIEKPLCTPTLDKAQELYELAKNSKTVVLTGFNHTVGKNTEEAEKLLKQNIIGNCLTIHSATMEYWGGIFKAHPWLSGPQDTYLGYYLKGGGASGEHSHAANMWQHLAHVLNLGRVVEVTATMDMVKEGKVEYDRNCNISVKTDKGFYGTIVQDVITEPVKKFARIQGENGFIEWHVGYDSTGDAVLHQQKGKSLETIHIPKKRPDDFKREVEHFDAILKGKVKPEHSPLIIERGMDTMMVLAAAHLSRQQKRTMKIDYSKGYNSSSISPA